MNIVFFFTSVQNISSRHSLYCGCSLVSLSVRSADRTLRKLLLFDIASIRLLQTIETSIDCKLDEPIFSVDYPSLNMFRIINMS